MAPSLAEFAKAIGFIILSNRSVNPQQILHLFRTGLDTVDIVAWLKLHDGVRLTEAQVVRAMHRAIEAERKAAEAA
jgi:hypothetical protein